MKSIGCESSPDGYDSRQLLRAKLCQLSPPIAKSANTKASEHGDGSVITIDR